MSLKCRRRIILLVGCSWLLGCTPSAEGPTPDLEPRPDIEPQVLAAPPLVGRPTRSSVTLGIVNGGEPAELELRLSGREVLRSQLAGHAIDDIVVGDLKPGVELTYELVARSAELEETFAGRFVTERLPGDEFTFAVFSDPHLPVLALDWLDAGEGALEELLAHSLFHAELGSTFRATMAAIRVVRPDFIVCLGDMFTLANEDFNPPFATRALARDAYVDFRKHLGRATSEAAFFAVIGNWDGENGWHPQPLREHGRWARRQLLLNPTPETYPQGGGPFGDYYAWTWGDALFVVLNVMSYTSTVHVLDEDENGTATSWTLGDEQWRWLEATLASSREPWKMLFLHHTVGGNGGDALNSAYGRGGYRAARVGEQGRLHELMVRRGVQVLFYGHDHVFTADVVDGVHYVLPGSAGAPWKFTTEETGYEDYDPRSGFARVRLGPSGIEIEFRDLESEVFRTIQVGGA